MGSKLDTKKMAFVAELLQGNVTSNKNITSFFKRMSNSGFYFNVTTWDNSHKCLLLTTKKQVIADIFQKCTDLGGGDMGKINRLISIDIDEKNMPKDRCFFAVYRRSFGIVIDVVEDKNLYDMLVDVERYVGDVSVVDKG